MKLCKDCKHFGGFFRIPDECLHPLNTYTDLVRGGTRTIYYPQELRLKWKDCGINGKWWETK